MVPTLMVPHSPLSAATYPILTYRDLKNMVDTSFDEGKAEIARQMKSEGEPVEKIVRFTGLTAEEIGRL